MVVARFRDYNGVARVDEDGLKWALNKARDRALKEDVPKATFFADFEAMGCFHKIRCWAINGCFGAAGGQENGVGMAKGELVDKVSDLMLHAAAKIGIEWVAKHHPILNRHQCDLLAGMLSYYAGMQEAMANLILCTSGMTTQSLDDLVNKTVILDAPPLEPVIPAPPAAQ